MFIGRTRELKVLIAAVREMRRGRGGFVVVVGEPGIGKTRTLEELAGRVRRNVRVLWGRCREAGDLPPYWPWAQVLRSYVETVPAPILREQLGASAAEVARIVPGLGEALGPPPAGTLGPSDARLRLFHAIATLLRAASLATPLLLILDDLHWADEASLHLLRFLVGELVDARVLIAAACRDAELRRDAALTALVGELVTSSERLPLGPLAASEVGDLIAAVAGVAVPGGVVARVHQRTGGNPLFVHEVTRLLLADGALTEGDPACWRIPEGVRAAIRYRLAALSPASREALAAAAVVGREFSVSLVAGVLGVTAVRVLALLDEAESLGMLQAVRDLADRRRFSHVLVRDTLYEDLPAEDRAVWHRRIGEAMAERHAGDLAPHLPALAYHFLQAGAAGDSARAVDYATRAGDRALALLAYEEAAGHYASALDALARSGADDPARRIALLLARGEAERSGGDRGAARATFRHAAELARTRGAAADFARAALGFTGMWIHQLMVDPDNVAMLEAALGRLDEQVPALRARLLARLAMELYYSPEVARCTALGAEAIRLARSVDEPETLAFALHAYNWALWRPDRLAERRATAAEMVATAERSGSPELLAESLAWRVRAELDAGDVAAVDAAIAIHERLARQTRRPLDLWRSVEWRLTRATMAGHFGAAECLLPEALAAATVAAERSQYFLALLYYAWDLHCLRREQGRAGDVLTEVGHLIEAFAMLQSVRVSLSEIHLAVGRRDEARRILDDFAATDFATMPYDVTWLRDMTLLAQVAVELGDEARAVLLYDRLRPCAGMHVALGALGYLGPVDRHLGRLAALLGRLDEAIAHLDAGLVACEHVGARPQLARTQRDLVVALRRRGGAGDVAWAERLHRMAAETASALGMVGLATELRALEMRPPTATVHVLAARREGRQAAVGGSTLGDALLASATEGPAALQPTFRRDGEFWTLAFDGTVVCLADSKGMRQIARLLAHPGAPQHVLDLAGDDSSGDRRALHGDAGALLDARARAAYRERLREARAELEAARRLGDLGAALRAEREIDALGGELARAVGLNGRERRAGAAAERARVAVVRTIRRAIDRITAVHPSLGHHLRTAISTGTACLYEPGPDFAVRWVL